MWGVLFFGAAGNAGDKKCALAADLVKFTDINSSRINEVETLRFYAFKSIA